MPTTKAILENVFGMLGIIFWSLQLLPQAIDNYKAKSTEGLSYSMFFIWTLCALGFGSYGVVEKLSIPLIIQPQIFGALAMVCYLQCLYYGKRTQWSLKKTLCAAVAFFAAMAAIQVGAIYATRSGIDRNVPGAVEAAGIIPIVLLVLGFVPQYIDIYRDRSVVGVSMVFIAADASGAVFSIISLIFRTEFDLLATLNYCAVLVCDFIIVFFYVYYNKMNPSMARVRGAPKARDLENGEIESGIVTVVESEVGENKDMESEKTVEHIQKLNLHGTAAPNHLVESVTKTTTASQVSLSSNHSNSTVAQA